MTGIVSGNASQRYSNRNEKKKNSKQAHSPEGTVTKRRGEKHERKMRPPP
jgi:hypothetical protein